MYLYPSLVHPFSVRDFLCLVLPFSACLCSCDDLPPASDDDLRVTVLTDKNVYLLDSSGVIGLAATNQSRDTVYYQCTGRIFLEEYDPATLLNSWCIHGFERCVSPTPIPPESTKVFSLDMLLLYKLVPSATFDSSVVYRLVFQLFEDTAYTKELNSDERHSNEFIIQH